MKKLLSITLFCASALGAFAFPSLDPFADTAGANLTGQTNAFGEKWYSIGATSTGAAVVITNDNLTAVSGLPASSGNAVRLVNQIGVGGRFNVPFYASTTNATLFYSALIKVNDITSLAFATTSTKSGGAFNMGFNNTAGTDAGQTTQPSIYGAPLYMGADGSGGYILGTGRAVGGAGNRFWETNSAHQLGDVVFVVAEYEIVAGTTNDIARLWINPNSSTFGTSTPPTPDIIVGDTNDVTTLPTTDADISAVNSFLLANRNATTPNDMVVDEVRLGTNWAQVTATYVPPAPVPTLSVSLLDPATVQLSWRGDATNYSLQGTSTLLSSGTPWTAVSGTPSTSGTNLIQNDTIGGSTKFYRLISTQ